MVYNKCTIASFPVLQYKGKTTLRKCHLSLIKLRWPIISKQTHLKIKVLELKIWNHNSNTFCNVVNK